MLQRTTHNCFGVKCCFGVIEIGTFREIFHMPVNVWSLAVYEQQWIEGIKRLQNHDSSCLVTEIQTRTKKPQATLWAFYKEEKKLYIQKLVLFGELIKEPLKNKFFTTTTCYDFIVPRGLDMQHNLKASEWQIDLEDVLRFLDEKRQLNDQNKTKKYRN